MLRKWQYIAEALKSLKAPSKIIDAAQEIDNILVSLKLDYNTPDWIVYLSKNEYQKENWESLDSIISDASFCSACCDINNKNVDCSDCKLSLGARSCTPRSKYAIDYTGTIVDYVHHKIYDTILTTKDGINERRIM